MTQFLAHENLQRQGDDGLILLADTFNWFAFLVPPIWAFSKGMWRVLIVMLALMGALLLLSQMFSLPIFTILILGAWWLGFEANVLLGAKLARRGWHDKGTFVATDLMQAERKFFARKRRLERRRARQNVDII